MTVIAMMGGAEGFDRLALEHAVSIARRMNTPLEVHSSLPDPALGIAYATTPYAPAVGPVVTENMVSAQRDMIAAWRDLYDDVISEFGADIAASFTHEQAATRAHAVNVGMLASPLVFPRGAARGAHNLSDAFEHTLMDTRLPVLLTGTTPHNIGPALIAWDGSAQAARAVRAHLPLIKLTGRAIIAQNHKRLERSKPDARTKPDLLAEWLHQHGVDCEVADFNGAVADGLLLLAQTHKCELIVAGAYGHSRAGEFLLGGTTRSLLRAEEAPALALCH